VTLAAAFLASCAPALAQDVSTIEHPYAGTTLIRRTTISPRKLNMRVLIVDLMAPGIRFKLTPPGGTLETTTRTTLQALDDQQAQFAVNSHFYLPVVVGDVNLIGLAASDGNVYSGFETPSQIAVLVPNAPGLNIDPKNRASIVHVDAAAAGGRHVAEDVTLWNTVSGSAQVITNGVITIPCYRDEARPGCELTPAREGRAEQSNSNSWYDTLNPRTVIGLSRDARTLVLFTVDGRDSSVSEGMKVGEIADLLIRDYGVYNALNLDGGGSTCMAMRDPVTGVGSILNALAPMSRPNGRSVGSSLAVFAASHEIPPATTVEVTPAPNPNGWNHTDVKVSLRASDAAGRPVRQVRISRAGDSKGGAPRTVAGSEASMSIAADGRATLSVSATDRDGRTGPAWTLPVRIDRTPPVIRGAPAASCTLGPADDRIALVGTYSGSDALSGLAPGALQVAASASEPTDPGDIVVAADDRGGMTVSVRAARLAGSAGRVYTFTATLTDRAGNVATSTSSCSVR
jgi:hypothetical protein